MSEDALYDELQSTIGRTGPQLAAPDEVTRSSIRHWCEAMEDANPLYTDEQYARRSKYGNVIAPAVSILAYVMPPLWPDGQSERYHPTRPKPPDEERDIREIIFELVLKHGYVGTMATNSTGEFIRPVYPGDRLFAQRKFVSVSRQKTTRVGVGYFMTFNRSITNQRGELVCNQMDSIFRFKPLGK